MLVGVDGDTVAIAGLDELMVKGRPCNGPELPVAVAASASVPDSKTESAAGEKAMVLMPASTRTTTSSVFPSEVAVIVAVPAATPVMVTATCPLALLTPGEGDIVTRPAGTPEKLTLRPESGAFAASVTVT